MLLLKNLLFTLVVPGTVAVYLPLWMTRDHGTASLAEQILGVLLLAAGGAVYLACVRQFAAFGEGTPAPIDAPKKLVARGIYRYVRNPMYLGVLSVIVGWSVFFHATALLAYAAAVGLCFHLFIVVYEEPRLRREFGEQYEAYCKQARRWLPGPPAATT